MAQAIRSDDGATPRLAARGRVRGFALVFATAGAASQLFRFEQGRESGVAWVISQGAGAAATVLATWFLLRRAHLSWTAIGLAARPRAARDGAAGVFIGAAIIVAGLGGTIAAAHASVAPVHPLGPALHALAVSTIPAVLFGAITEELLFRGYGFQAACEWLGPGRATAAVSTLFAVAHVGSPGVGPIAIAGAGCASLLLCLVLLRTRSLWACIGLHLGVNAAQAALGSPISGLAVPGRILDARLDGSWMADGASGLEAAVPTVVLFAIAAAAVSRWRAPEVASSDPYRETGA